MIVDSEKYSVVTRVVGYATSQVRLAASGNAALEHTEKRIRTENGKIVFGLAVRRQAPTIEKLGVWRDGICPGSTRAVSGIDLIHRGNFAGIPKMDGHNAT